MNWKINVNKLCDWMVKGDHWLWESIKFETKIEELKKEGVSLHIHWILPKYSARQINELACKAKKEIIDQNEYTPPELEEDGNKLIIGKRKKLFEILSFPKVEID